MTPLTDQKMDQIIGALLRWRVRGIVSGIPGFHWGRVIQLGLVLLMATPVARVAFSVVAFVMQRDRTYVTITLIVLAVLLFGLTGRISG
jgi:uncharacterized membrane protein